MWKSFQGALEKRVRINDRRQIVPDKYIIGKAAKKVIADYFGAIGYENIEIVSSENEIVRLRSKKSIWRSELMLKRDYLKQQINKEIGQEAIKEIIVVS